MGWIEYGLTFHQTHYMSYQGLDFYGSNDPTNSVKAVMLGWQDSYISKMTYRPSKLGQTDLVLGLIRVYQ